MSMILTCGPFAATSSNGNCFITFPLRTQGDWVNTDEGHDAMEKAVNSLACASDEGKIHKNSDVQWRGDDVAIVSVPYESWEAAMKDGAALKDRIAKITGATVTDMARSIK
jgi:hypothetical protein